MNDNGFRPVNFAHDKFQKKGRENEIMIASDWSSIMIDPPK
jgi:hypothetical protein